MENTEKHLLFESVNKTVRRTGFREHVNTTAELYVCLGGSANDNIDGVEKRVVTGDVYVLEADVSHFQTNANMFKCCVFQFERSAFEKQAASLGISGKMGYRLMFDEGRVCFVDGKTLTQIEALADVMREESDTDLLDVLFLSVVSLICTRSDIRRGEDSLYDDDVIGKVISFMEQNYSKKLTLNDLARMTNYSCRHFTRLVRERLSASPMEYLDTVRINRACDMLANTTLTVSEIGVRCGFDDGNLFSRHFKIRKNMSPTLYRRKAIDSMEAKNSAVRVNIVEKRHKYKRKIH